MPDFSLALCERDRRAQTVLERDVGLPTEQLARPADIRAAARRIVQRQRLIDDFERNAGEPAHDLRELAHVALVRIAEVDRNSASQFGRGAPDHTLDQIIDVTVRARLRTVALNRQGLGAQRLIDESRYDSAVLAPHARPIRVEDAHDTGVETALPDIRHHERLSETLRFVVARARAERVTVAPIRLGLAMLPGDGG